MPKLEKAEVKKLLRDYETKPTAYWQAAQKKKLMQVFKTASDNVSAYPKFLRGQDININKIISEADVSSLPAINKANYFWKSSLADVAEKGKFGTTGLVMTATSGSTGHPTYFPRDERIDWQYSVLAEFFLKQGPPGPTLLIDCFGMGVWIGGLITYQAFRYAALRDRPITVITPGINKKEIFHSLRELAPQFKNVIIAGYPPFIKDILDESTAEKISFDKFHTRLLFAAESFTEKFRDYVCEKAKIKNPFLDTLNIYGSAELGAMAFETPGTIFIRKLALEHPKIFKTLFPRGGEPTLAQYNPEFVLFQEQNEKILITAPGPVPFLRYDIGDTGGTYTLETFIRIFNEHGVNLKLLAEQKNIKLLHLPFVYVHVRSDFATKLYGAIIHPEPVQEALQHRKFKTLLTGKFTLETLTDKQHNQYLAINAELKPKANPNGKLANLIKQSVIANLLKNNAEYKNNYHSIPKKVIPVIKLWQYESPEYFKPGTKQKWVINSK